MISQPAVRGGKQRDSPLRAPPTAAVGGGAAPKWANLRRGTGWGSSGRGAAGACEARRPGTFTLDHLHARLCRERDQVGQVQRLWGQRGRPPSAFLDRYICPYRPISCPPALRRPRACWRGDNKRTYPKTRTKERLTRTITRGVCWGVHVRTRQAGPSPASCTLI